MAQNSTALEHYNIVNCEFVVCDDGKIRNSLELLQAADNVEYVKETSFYIQQGEYILPVHSKALMDESNQDSLVKEEDECVQYEVDQCDQTIIYCTPEQYAEYSQMWNKDDDQDATSIIIDESVEDDISTNEEMDDVQVVSVQNASEFEDSNESNSVAEYIPYEELLERPNYQYAILKNGQLHLQTLNIEDEQKLYLKEQLDAFQASISFDSDRCNINKSEVAALDLTKITGKNLITGQTVTLEKYMNKLMSNVQNNCINKRVVIGKTSNGKKLVGKILHVQKGETKDKPSIYRRQFRHNTKTLNKQIKSLDKNTSSIVDTVGNVLVSLMNLQSIHQRLYSKDLIVKLFMRTYNSENGMFNKNVFLIYGYMENTKDKWYFLGTKVDDCKEYDNDVTLDFDDDIQRVQNKDPPVDNIRKKKLLQSSDTKIDLSLLITINKDGKTTTKVHFGPNTSVLDPIKDGFEVQIHNKLYGCDECFKMYQNEVLLFQHKKMQHVQRWHFCTVCAKTFNSAGSLKRHFTVHDPSLRPLQCTVCLLRFTDQSSLTKHLLIHTGIRAFVCKMCHRSFINQGDLNFHSRIHDSVKQFTCEVCGREFSRQSNLIRHAEIHRGESALFQCHLCGCSYSFPSSLTRHIVHKHLGNFTEDTQN